MYCRFIRCLLLLTLTVAVSAKAQQGNDELTDLYSELDSLFAGESIPSNLFELADSILALEKTRYSAFNIRTSYVSEVMSAGRTFGPDQYGFIPGITYFHYSGLSASVTGYSSNEYDPGYYLTTFNVTYSKNLIKDVILQVSHDFYLYNDTLETHSFDKSAEVATILQHKWADAGIEYGFLYGNDQAHRVNTYLNGRIKIKPGGYVDVITIMPGTALQWGNADVYYWRQPRTAVSDLYHIVSTNDFPRLTRREYLRLTYLLETDRRPAAALFLHRREYSFQEIQQLFEEYERNSVNTVDTFGFMNLSFSCPVVFRRDNVSFLLNYTWNIPQRLPGETYDYEPSGYLTASLSYTFTWKKR